jgi:hypothetical protein
MVLMNATTPGGVPRQRINPVYFCCFREFSSQNG